MKTIFKKSHLPFIRNTLKNGNGRDFWNLARTMQDENGLQHQLPAEIMLLKRGANQNDPWAMCELARTYFYHCGDVFLPHALHYWKQAAMLNDEGAKYDLAHAPILNRILSYHSFDNNEYKEIEMKCALLAEFILHKPWLGAWNTLDDYTKEARCNEVAAIVCQFLQIPKVTIEIIPNLTFQGMIVDGLASWDNKISIRKEIFNGIVRVIELIFHELGHMIAFEIIRNTPNGLKLKEICGITDQRIKSWENQDMGYEVVTSEEDPDTLSYGVYTLWATFFN